MSGDFFAQHPNLAAGIAELDRPTQVLLRLLRLLQVVVPEATELFVHLCELAPDLRRLRVPPRRAPLRVARAARRAPCSRPCPYRAARADPTAPAAWGPDRSLASGRAPHDVRLQASSTTRSRPRSASATHIRHLGSPRRRARARAHTTLDPKRRPGGQRQAPPRRVGSRRADGRESRFCSDPSRGGTYHLRVFPSNCALHFKVVSTEMCVKGTRCT